LGSKTLQRKKKEIHKRGGDSVVKITEKRENKKKQKGRESSKRLGEKKASGYGE